MTGEVSPPSTGVLRRLHRYALLVAVSTLGLIYAGGMVTTTKSGLSVPDWPLSFGTFFPEMIGGVFFEHGHRAIAGAVGLMTLMLAIWLQLSEPRRWVRGLGWIALSMVVIQGALGGLTVLWRMPLWVSASHACLAQLFFCTVVSLAMITGPWWRSVTIGIDQTQLRPRTTTLGVLSFGMLMVQLVLGVLMRHTDAWLAIPSVPDVDGALWPPAGSSWPIWLHYSHRVGALAAALLIGWLVIRIHRRHADQPRLIPLAQGLAGLVVVQIGLGFEVVASLRQIDLTTLHVANGALLLAATWLLTLRAMRLAALGAAAPTEAAPAPASERPVPIEVGG